MSAHSPKQTELDKSLIVHRDHVSAVLDVCYSPTGKEFVSASYDRSIRIFTVKPGWESKGRSREVYTAPRMQRVFACRFSLDSHFVFSGSEDGNVRVWKAVANRNMSVLAPKQKLATEYNDALLNKFKQMKEIRKIHNKRMLPKSIFKEGKKQTAAQETDRRKKTRMVKHSKMKVDTSSLREKAVVRVND
jgi:WD repeat and SOF domain-containing protein 1